MERSGVKAITDCLIHGHFSGFSCLRPAAAQWIWIFQESLHEDAHRYRGNGAGAMATLRTAALNLLRLAGFQSIRAGMQAVMHDITALLAMAMRQPKPNPC